MKRKLTFPLAVVMTVCLAVPAAAYTDDASIPHLEAVSVLTERGILHGKPDGRFDPNGGVLRSEMATMLSLVNGPAAEEVPSSGFTDVAGSWAERYIDHCFALGLVAGRGGGTFAPDDPVTGTEAAVMLLAASGYDTSAFPGGSWAERVNEAAEAAGLYRDFTADPALPLTRAGAALLIYNALGNLSTRVLRLSFAPTGVTAMPDGSLLLTDTFNRVVVRWKDGELDQYAGTVTQAADVNGQPLGGYYDASTEASTFKLPWAAAPFLDGCAVSDAENNAVRLIQGGQVQTINPSGSTGSLAYPTGLAAGSGGSLYVSDTHNGLIRCITPDGKMTTAARGLQDPMGLCWRDGVLYIAETGANRIVQLKDGKLTTVAGSGTEGYADGRASAARFSGPKAVAVDGNGTVYVSDTGNSAVRRIKDGQVTTLLIRDPADDADVPTAPVGLALAGRQLYVCDEFTWTLLILEVE